MPTPDYLFASAINIRSGSRPGEETERGLVDLRHRDGGSLHGGGCLQKGHARLHAQLRCNFVSANSALAANPHGRRENSLPRVDIPFDIQPHLLASDCAAGGHEQDRFAVRCANRRSSFRSIGRVGTCPSGGKSVRRVSPARLLARISGCNTYHRLVRRCSPAENAPKGVHHDCGSEPPHALW